MFKLNTKAQWPTSGGIIVEKMNLKSIRLAKQCAPQIVRVQQTDGFFLNTTVSNDFRIRKEVYMRLKKARAHLPQGLSFMVFEAYRPRTRQIEEWNAINNKMRIEHPHVCADDLNSLCENFIANPHDGIGSGHQACCAVDITLCNPEGQQLDMGTAVHEFNALTRTKADGLSKEVKQNRRVLADALETEQLVNYPGEWWHFSYGDHQWAWLTGKSEALYAPLDLPEEGTVA